METFEFNIEDINSVAYKEGWEAWNNYADDKFKIYANNPYPPDSRNFYLWNRGWNTNNKGLYDCDENETEDFHLKQFDELIRFELHKYENRGGKKYEDLRSFYQACTNGEIEENKLTGLEELKDVFYHLANNKPPLALPIKDLTTRIYINHAVFTKK